MRVCRKQQDAITRGTYAQGEQWLTRLSDFEIRELVELGAATGQVGLFPPYLLSPPIASKPEMTSNSSASMPLCRME